ncbi:MAG: hypothetical protein WKF94_09140 [Solirubrobacteraceae bacterium]
MKRIIFAAFAAILLLPATAMARDSNNDRLPDSWERSHNLSLKKNQARRDQDRDGVRNLAEFKHNLDPRDDDSDDDGTDDDGEAGRVTNYDDASGVLVITLLDGTALSGIVNDSTEIECDASDDSIATRSSDEDEDEENEDEDNSVPGQGAGDDDDDEGLDGDDDGNDGDSDCTTAALTVGALVHEAELEVTTAGSVWDEIELV